MSQPSPTLLQHVRALARAYEVKASSDGVYVRVDNFVLPPEFNVPTTAVLLRAPPDFPLRPIGLWPYAAWVGAGLRYRGNRVPDIVEGRGPGFGAWSWVCITRIDWRPTDDLFRVLEIVRTVLSNPNVW